MTTPTRPGQAGDAGSDTTDDDQHWFDLLAGRPSAGADATTRAEAARLRQALLQHRAAAPAGDPAAPDDRIARLLGRARAEGVLAAPSATAPPLSSPQHRRRQAWAGALAAGVAGLVITLLLRSPDDQGAPKGMPEAVLRGAPVQQLQAADPQQRRQQLLQALRAAGLDAHSFDRLGRAGLDIALPVPLPAAQARALADLGIADPHGPSLQIELLPAAPPLAPVAPASAIQTR
jgi:hypothetical protein